jgi:hypothetical protein
MKSILDKYKNAKREARSSAPLDQPSSKRAREASKPDEKLVPPSSSSSPQEDATVTVVFSCNEGSVTHFYHFFFGAMIPLIDHHLNNPGSVYRISTDVGPMKRILCELPLTILELMGPYEASSRIYHDDKSMRRPLKSGELQLPAYDCFNELFYRDIYLCVKISKAIAARVLNFFASTIPPYIAEIETPFIVLIERAVDSYYSSGLMNRQEIYQTSGSERRSITNHRELVDALRSKFGRKFGNIVLERSSIYYQYHVFRKAKIVLAQHGAALANVFFMQGRLSASDSSSSGHKSTVVEFSPPWSREFQHFKNVCEFAGVKHIAVEQLRDHSEVNIENVIEIVESEWQSYS